MPYLLKPKKHFIKKFKNLIAKNKQLEGRLEIVLDKLTINPFDISLQTHKVRAKLGIEAYSSRINGDLRIIWEFNQDKIQVIDLLDIGGHSGNRKVYD
jgi:mRNA-degrading endonuclease YafQ of YafQ-DinJ toxin-antitoxin module